MTTTAASMKRPLLGRSCSQTYAHTGVGVRPLVVRTGMGIGAHREKVGLCESSRGGGTVEKVEAERREERGSDAEHIAQYEASPVVCCRKREDAGAHAGTGEIYRARKQRRSSRELAARLLREQEC